MALAIRPPGIEDEPECDAGILTIISWGLIPHWAKEEKTAYQMINARLETLAQRPALRRPLAADRGLVPASGFSEFTIRHYAAVLRRSSAERAMVRPWKLRSRLSL